MCYLSSLAALDHGGCFQRDTMVASTSMPVLPQLAVYVLTVPTLTRRIRRMRERLQAARVADVTWVRCASREAVQAFDASTRRCLHPE